MRSIPTLGCALVFTCLGQPAGALQKPVDLPQNVEVSCAVARATGEAASKANPAKLASTQLELSVRLDSLQGPTAFACTTENEHPSTIGRPPGQAWKMASLVTTGLIPGRGIIGIELDLKTPVRADRKRKTTDSELATVEENLRALDEGRRLIGEGDQAIEKKDWHLAMRKYQSAQARCKGSTVAREAGERLAAMKLERAEGEAEAQEPPTAVERVHAKTNELTCAIRVACFKTSMNLILREENHGALMFGMSVEGTSGSGLAATLIEQKDTLGALWHWLKSGKK